VVLDADLSCSTQTAKFAAVAPERFINCGIAEADMIGVAGGLSTCGKVPFASTFAVFAAGRAFEQIRNTVCHGELNVKVAATHAGITVGEDGATHQCNEDIALMRTLPGMLVINPSDAVEAQAAVKFALEHNGPCYLRFGRFATPVLHDPDTYSFELGKGETLRDGTDVTIVATGLMVSMALEAAETLAAEGISARVINMATIKPLDGEILEKAAVETGAVVTAEEHSVIGGLGSAVAETLSMIHPVPVYRVGVMDSFGRSGKVPPLLKLYGLTPENIVAKAKLAIAAKK